MKIKNYNFKPVPLTPINYLFKLFKNSPSNKLSSSNKLNKILFDYARYAMLYAIKSINNNIDAEIWVPFYYCKESVIPLVQNNLKVKFYPVNECFEPDFKWLDRKKIIPNSIFIYVHYFGIKNDFMKAKTFCSNKKIFFIEDGAHLYNPNNMGNMISDAIIFSPRKFLPIPDGGILLMRGNYKIDKTLLKENKGKKILFWYIYRILQNIFLPNISLNRENNIKNNIKNHFKSISVFTKKILVHMLNSDSSVMNTRIHNYKYLYDRLKNISPAFKIFPYNKHFSPYAFPIFFYKNSNQLFEKLKFKNFPVSKWPDLPDIIDDNDIDIKKLAQDIREKTIIIPIHQDLKEHHLNQMINIIKTFY